MKRLLFIVALFCGAPLAHGQLVLVGGCAATATSCTPVVIGGGVFATGQFQYTFAYRSALTAPTLPGTFTALDTASASTSSFRSGCLVMTSSTPDASVWTNATRVLTLVFSGALATSTANCVTAGVGFHTSAGASGTTSTYTFTGGTLTKTDGTSFVIGSVGSSAAACIPGSLTSRETTTNGIIADAESVSTFVTATCTGTAGNWKTDTVEILAACVGICLVQHSPCHSVVSATTVACTIAANTIPNLIVVGASNAGGCTVTGVADNASGGSNTYSQASSALATANSTDKVDVWHVLSATNGGATTVTVTFSCAAGTFSKDAEVWEVKGFTGSGAAFDVSNTVQNTQQTNQVDLGASVTTTGATDFVVGVARTAAGGSIGANPAAGNEFTTGGDIPTAQVGAVSLITSSASAHQPSWTDGNSFINYAASTVAYKQSGAAPATPAPKLLMMNVGSR